MDMQCNRAPRNLLDYYGYQLSLQSRLRIAVVGLALQLMLGYSYMGFITIPPISITTLTTVVILTAILLGPIEAMLQGALFGVSSMWQATTSGLSAGDLLFAPTLSGEPVASVVLAVGSRVAFGLTAGLLAWLVIRRKPGHIIPWLVVVSVVSQLMHTVYVYAAMGHYFPATGAKAINAITGFISFDHFITYGFTVLMVFLMVQFIKRENVKNFLQIANERPVKADRTELIGIIALAVFTIFAAVASFAHMMSRMEDVYTKLDLKMPAQLEHLTDMVFYQFMTSLAGALLILYIVFSAVKWYYANRDRSRLEETNRQLHEAKLKAEESQRIAEEANQAKTSFLFNMSHDIRTPLNAIVGFTELAGKKPDDLEQAEDYRQKVLLASTQLADILNNVLEMARIENKKVVIEEELTDIEELYESTCAIFEGETEKKHQSLHTVLDVQHRYLYLDRTHLSEIMMNVLSNAIKYTPEHGSIDVSFRELPGERDGECMIETVVKDTGIGMTDEYVSEIFEEFSRARNSSQSGIQGTGLGMAIVKSLVELMQGTISIKSKVGEGTEISICIPLRIGEAPKNIEEIDVSSRHDLLEGKRILLAEDIDVNALLVQEILTMNGMESERAKDGVECVSMLNRGASGYYDLILMDIQMPNLNGYDATRQIRNLADKQKAEIPILALSANAFKEDMARSLEAGMNGHIAKPINVDDLMDKLSEMIGKHQMMSLEDVLAANEISLFELETCSEGVYITDESRQIRFWNAAAERITGYGREHIEGKHCFYSGLKHEDAQCNQLCERNCPLTTAILNGAQYDKQVSVLCSDGQRKWIRVRAIPLYANGTVHGAVEFFLESEISS